MMRLRRRQKNQDRPSRLSLIVRGLVLVLGAVAWAVVVWSQPGLHLGNSSSSRGLQPAVLIAAASIQAAVVVFGLAVGAIVLQVMASYSWAVVRSVLPGWLAPVVVIVVGAGVVFPLWVSFSPTERLSTDAFAAFGWSVLAVGVTAWETAQRMNPPSLSVRTRRRAVIVLSRDHRNNKASSAVADVLGQLVASAELPYHEGLRMVGSYATVLAYRSRSGAHREVAVAIRALGERAVSAESEALASSIVMALWVLGLDQADHPPVFNEAHGTLTAIAADARRRGRRELASAALDALASITFRRVGRVLPAVGYQTPRRPLTPQPPPRRTEEGFFPPPVFPSSLPPSIDPKPETLVTSRTSRQNLLNRFVRDFAADNDALAEELAATLEAGLSRPTDSDDTANASRHDSRTWWEDYELLTETVDTLLSLLTSPQPASTGWPAGWQGHGTFDADVQRLAGLAEGLYRQGKHVPSDLVEAALESIGVRLRTEQPPGTDLPAARTSWRDLPTRSEEGGIAAITATCMSTLMSAAFDAGFDRRALSTGLRILASATASAKRGDRAATAAYANALTRFTLDTSLHGLEAHSQAGSHRVQAVLIGVISECDQLLDAARQQKGHDSEISQAVEDLAIALAWNTPHPRMFATVIAMLQVRLASAGWPVDLPSGQRRAHESEPVAPPPPRPLSGDVLSEAETLFTDWISHGEVRLSAAALVALWAHAACAVRDGSPDEARRIAALLTEQRRIHDKWYARMLVSLAAHGEEQSSGYRALDPQLRRIIRAAARWCARADISIAPVIPHAPGQHTVHDIARRLASDPDTSNWIYRGIENKAETHLVSVEMADHSRRVLRDRDLRTGDLRWGYTGTGASDLSSVLLADILAEHSGCPHCFGVIPFAANIITCSACSNTGMRPGTLQAENDLLTKIIAELPDEFERTRLELLRALADM
jgi:hypothetical protein